MKAAFRLIKPKLTPPLDQDFRPAVLANHAFLEEVDNLNVGVPLVLGLERSDGYLSRFETQVFPEGHERAEANLEYIERIVKFLMWQKGGWKIYVGGPRNIGEFINKCYSPDGAREFDYQFMEDFVYCKPFMVVPCEPDEVPAEVESGQPLG